MPSEIIEKRQKRVLLSIQTKILFYLLRQCFLRSKKNIYKLDLTQWILWCVMDCLCKKKFQYAWQILLKIRIKELFEVFLNFWNEIKSFNNGTLWSIIQWMYFSHFIIYVSSNNDNCLTVLLWWISGLFSLFLHGCFLHEICYIPAVQRPRNRRIIQW